MKSVVANDWEGDVPLRHPRRRGRDLRAVPARGFTMHLSSGVTLERAGTFAGLVEKIPYLCDLGGTAVELLPVFQFDATRQRVAFLVAPGEGEA